MATHHHATLSGLTELSGTMTYRPKHDEEARKTGLTIEQRGGLPNPA